jgi:hypothetical protein
MGDAPGLSDQQRRALDRLSGLPVLRDFYLAGGSALAIQFAHRRSADLDFFSRAPVADLEVVKGAVATVFDHVVVRAETDAALHLVCDGLPIDFVRYPYPPLDGTTEMNGVAMASARDLAVMKLSAISRRGLRRYFWDLYEVLRRTTLTLRACGEAYVQRFGVREADLYHVLRGLTYFDDAEKDPVFPPGLDAKTWTAIQEFFRGEAPKLVGPAGP